MDQPDPEQFLHTPSTSDAEGRIDIRLHAPTPDAVIVRVAGALGAAAVAVLVERTDQQLRRAPHVIVDLADVIGMDGAVVELISALRHRAERCGSRLYFAGIADEALARHLGVLDLPGRRVTVAAIADALVAALAGTATPHRRNTRPDRHVEHHRRRRTAIAADPHDPCRHRPECCTSGTRLIPRRSASAHTLGST